MSRSLLMSIRISDDSRSRMLVFISIPTSKNSLMLGPYVTDVDGHVAVPSEDVQNAFHDASTASPMDYGPVADVTREPLTIEIPSKDAFEERLARLRTFYPAEARRLATIAAGATFPARSHLWRQVLPRDSTEIVLSLRD